MERIYKMIVTKTERVCYKCACRIHKNEAAYVSKIRRGIYMCVNCGRAITMERKLEPETSFSAAVESVGQDGFTRIEWDSISAVMSDASRVVPDDSVNSNRIREHEAKALSGKDEWGNYYTRERLRQELTNPSSKLMDAVEVMRKELTGELNVPTAPRRKLRRNQEWGENLDVDQWAAKNPSAWDRIERTAEPKRTVTIACNVAISGSKDEDHLLYRGAAALALADYLTDNGYSVDIKLVFCGMNMTNKENVLAKINVKPPDMPLDLSGLAFSFCQIAFARCVILGAIIRKVKGVLHKGMGYVGSMPTADAAKVDYLIDETIICKNDAIVWLNVQIAKSQKEAVHLQ